MSCYAIRHNTCTCISSAVGHDIVHGYNALPKYNHEELEYLTTVHFLFFIGNLQNVYEKYRLHRVNAMFWGFPGRCP